MKKPKKWRQGIFVPNNIDKFIGARAIYRSGLELKFFSIIYPSKQFQTYLEKSGSGSIVCVSSLLSRQPEPKLVATAAARAGQLNLIHSMAIELAPTIRVNSILIGTVESGQWQRRFEADKEFDRSAKLKG